MADAQLDRYRRDQPRKPRRRPSLESPLSQMTLVGTGPLPGWQVTVMNAKTPAEREAWPVVPWTEREAQWRAHAETPEFGARLEKAKAIAREGAAKGKMFASLSGGKDSVALAGVLKEAGVDVRGVYASSKLDYPGTLETLGRLAERLGMLIDWLEPREIDRHVERVCEKYGTPKPRKRRGQRAYDEWDLLRCFPPDVVVLDEQPMADIVKALGHANMLTDHMYKAGYDGSFNGVRRLESLARHFNWRKSGAVYRSKVDGKWSATPIVEWSGKDVWAFITTRGLPVIEYYKLAYETGLSRDDPAKIRTGGLPYRDLAEKGVLAPVARVYPAYWQKLIAHRPELERYAHVQGVR